MKEKTNFSKFLFLWTGELISAIGGGLTSFGLGIYIFNQTGSAAAMAIITLLGFLPTLFLSVPAGILADRFDRRLLMMIGDGCSGLGVLFILLCMIRGEATMIEIGIGVTISAVFSALLEPAYKATVTDLLTKEEFSKASGLVGLAGSARYLISPFLAGLLLAVADIKLLLVIDICTFFVTVFATAVIRKGLTTKKIVSEESMIQLLKIGWSAITEKRGVFILILVSSVMTCFMGALQILAEPMILDFADATTLSIGETVCASGMLVTSLYLGMRGIKKNYVKVLCTALVFAGLGMVVFGSMENIYIICIGGFFFFAMLPFANNCLDYLVRINIADELQGRVWGLIGFLSQIGYVVAYSLAGVIADKIGYVRHIGVGRGAAGVIVISGILLAGVAAILYTLKEVHKLEGGRKIEEKTCME